MTVADRIKETREQKGLTQLELANRIGLKSKTSITRIEQSGDNVSLKDVQRIAEALGCSPLYLMGWVNPYNEELPPHTSHIIHYFNLLSAKNQDAVEAYIKFLIEEENKRRK